MSGRTITQHGERFGIRLSEAEYAKIGLLTVLETRAKLYVRMALKAVAGFDFAGFTETERWQLSQITERLLLLAKDLDGALFELVRTFDELRLASHDLRHRYVHAAWAITEEERPMARDDRRDVDLSPADLDDAVDAVHKLTEQGFHCAVRVGRLIARGIVQTREEPPPNMRLRLEEGWVYF